ncbi:TetR/AcrR family transcriptional regulator [Heyndrickxia ginsengihumi]|uniref:TetR/AcrR family transcriptional regulator n=1 Tax=Heyndrickxia ginsengihumi TaxID=363870 RepID=A0A6M0P4V9_9BACI|nr:TetR/AcrR family transcriptional regulator [Heyndrickxia ginsengihumi]MCM3022721.1 TetR/AcrR family transcriptional regulator [Heyndrickxia ginsengihumi]NEY18940.1 TetR/AcrR family transcriptional regulator [Heyndrickxia ginsengihumi]
MTSKDEMRITKKKIIDASWDLLRDEGIEGFTMRKLAEKINVRAASLYYHFKSKQSIFQVLADQVAKETLISTSNEGSWKEQLHQFALNLHKHLKEFPCSAQLLMQTVPLEHNYLSLINYLLNIIDQVPISDQKKFSSVICLLNYVISFEVDLYEQNKVNKIMEKEGQDTRELFRQSIENLQSVNKNVLQRIHQNQFLSEMGSEQMFQTGLTILILGIEQLAKE